MLLFLLSKIVPFLERIKYSILHVWWKIKLSFVEKSGLQSTSKALSISDNQHTVIKMSFNMLLSICNESKKIKLLLWDSVKCQQFCNRGSPQ